MRTTPLLRLCIIVIAVFSLVSCTRKIEQFDSPALGDYMPLQVGKYITYRLDSLVFTNFGRDSEIRSYQMKEVVDAQLPDNLGRPSYRIYTYLTDSTGTQPWNTMGSYFVTPLANQVEVTDDNLRVIKLHLPIKEGYQWPGNSYLPSEPYAEMYDFNNDNSMKDWVFSYSAFEPAYTFRGNSFTDVFTVTQQDDQFNVPITDVNSYGYKTQAIEKYAKGVGLIYRKYEMWEYQPNPSGPSPYTTGFGITLWVIDHN